MKLIHDDRRNNDPLIGLIDAVVRDKLPSEPHTKSLLTDQTHFVCEQNIFLFFNFVFGNGLTETLID